MEHLQAHNRKLLSNILPEHVADYFLGGDIEVRNYRFLHAYPEKYFTAQNDFCYNMK